MKNIFYSLLLLSFVAFSQSPDKNYTKTTYYKKPFTTSNPSPSPEDAFTTVSYVNGFGKKIQEVQSQISGTGKDMIHNYEYDVNGQIKKSYLPFTIGTTNMYYDNNASTNASSFSLYSGQTPYNEVVYEKSPLKKVLQVAGEGNDWDLPLLPIDEDHTKKYEYLYNSATDNVKLYTANATWNPTKGLYDITLINYTGAKIYNDNELRKNISKNENWILAHGNDNTIQHFKDKSGKLILKRSFENNIPHDTYYVYDQFGNLTYIIPPAVTNVSSQINGMGYQYKYDDKNRLVEKKLPGKQWQFIVYDKLNRMVASGPNYSPFNNSPAGTVGWLITKYDVFSRVVYTGWQSATVNTTTRKSMQDAQNGVTGSINETKTTSGTIDGITAYYTNNISPTSFKLLTVNYYDNYNFPNTPIFKATVEGQSVLTTPKSLPTGNWSRTLTTLTSIVGETNAVYYDTKGRNIRVYNLNYLGGYTEKETKLDFVGFSQYEITSHKRLGSDPNIIKTTDSYTYTPQGRLDTHSHQIGTNPAELMSKNYYDEIGQLITKKVGNSDLSGNTSFQKVDYKYNIKGWLTEINNINDLSEIGSPVDLFAFKINYNQVQSETGYTGKKLYNGNIAETYWKSKTDNVLRKYGYYYDNLDRFKDAIYQKPGASPAVTNSYNESVQYDKNGNITSLVRNGSTDGISPPTLIDNLAYAYDTYSNQLLRVTETPSSLTKGFKDGTNSGDDYTYDNNGNLISDLNKGITAIVYNHFNLPIKITFGTTGNIQYIYNSLGTKIQKKVTQGITITTTDYLTGYQYKNTILQFFPTAQGYVTKSGSIYKYVYQYKDHLGNIRVTYTKNTSGNLEIIEESHFYPFGLKHSGYNSSILASGNIDAQKYKFGGKELQDELSFNVYDFEARNYDPILGRYMNIDPLAELAPNLTPFRYCFNNPISFIDPTGLFEGDYDDDPDYNYFADGWGLGKDGQWHYRSDVTKENFKELGYSKYAEDGSIVDGARIEYGDGTIGETGYIYLGYGENDFHYVSPQEYENEIQRDLDIIEQTSDMLDYDVTPNMYEPQYHDYNNDGRLDSFSIADEFMVPKPNFYTSINTYSPNENEDFAFGEILGGIAEKLFGKFGSLLLDTQGTNAVEKQKEEYLFKKNQKSSDSIYLRQEAMKYLKENNLPMP